MTRQYSDRNHELFPLSLSLYRASNERSGIRTLQPLCTSEFGIQNVNSKLLTWRDGTQISSTFWMRHKVVFKSTCSPLKTSWTSSNAWPNSLRCDRKDRRVNARKWEPYLNLLVVNDQCFSCEVNAKWATLALNKRPTSKPSHHRSLPNSTVAD